MRVHSLVLLLTATPLLLGACGESPVSVTPADTTAPRILPRAEGLPPGWGGTHLSLGYVLGTDHLHQRTGRSAAYIAAKIPNPGFFATLTQSVRADGYRGHRVRWSGWARPTAIGEQGAAFWMRVDGLGLILAFDNMSDRRILGTADWSQFSVVLDVPAEAVGLSFGAFLAGSGDLVVDDFRLEEVGANVPTTNQLPQPVPSRLDSALAAAYATMPTVPVNLDFEGLYPPRSR